MSSKRAAYMKEYQRVRYNLDINFRTKKKANVNAYYHKKKALKQSTDVCPSVNI